MKVGMVTLFPIDHTCISGGVAGVGVYLTKALCQIPGVQVEVVACDGDVAEPCTKEFDGFRVHYFPLFKTPLSILQLFNPSFRWARRKLAELNCDIVHVQGLSPVAAPLTCPHVLTIHGIVERDALYHGDHLRWLKSRYYRLREQRNRGKIPNLILINPYVREAIGHQLKGRTWDIPNPVADHFFDVPHEPQGNRIFFGGKINERKNLLGLIRAFALVVRDSRQAQLRLAGEGADSPYGQACRQLAARLGVADKVCFLGNLKVDQLKVELAAASCLALCSYQETAPVIIEEAMAAGVPVVASRRCGMPYMIEDGRSGLLVEPDDADGVAQALRSTFDPATNASMSARSRRIAHEQFRASVVAAKTYEVYKTILGQR